MHSRPPITRRLLLQRHRWRHSWSLRLALFLAGAVSASAAVLHYATGGAPGSSTNTLVTNVNTIQGEGKLTFVPSPSRATGAAFRHETPSGSGHRSELDDNVWNRTRGTYWYGWSYYLAQDSFDHPEFSVYLGQWRFSNLKNRVIMKRTDGRNVGGSGHHLKHADRRWVYTLVHQDPGAPDGQALVVVERVLTLNGQPDGPVYIPVYGAWVDFVMQASWTHESGGFIKIWSKPAVSSSYRLVLDYHGPTWLNTFNPDSDYGGRKVPAPEKSFGLYYNNGRNGGAAVVMFSDELRIADNASGPGGFDEVRPDQEAPTTPGGTRPER